MRTISERTNYNPLTCLVSPSAHYQRRLVVALENAHRPTSGRTFRGYAFKFSLVYQCGTSLPQQDFLTGSLSSKLMTMIIVEASPDTAQWSPIRCKTGAPAAIAFKFYARHHSLTCVVSRLLEQLFAAHRIQPTHTRHLMRAHPRSHICPEQM